MRGELICRWKSGGTVTVDVGYPLLKKPSFDNKTHNDVKA
jgi:hypothetical protein